MEPIGRVIKGRAPNVPAYAGIGGQAQPGPGDGWEEMDAEIEIDPAWEEALDGVEGFSHIWVVWWLDRADETPPPAKVHPEGRKELPAVGLFATRSPRRPNPLAITPVRLLARRGNHLRVQGLDAFVDTPVLDIKPYLRRGDLIPEAGVPEWLEQLWRLHDEERRR